MRMVLGFNLALSPNYDRHTPKYYVICISSRVSVLIIVLCSVLLLQSSLAITTDKIELSSLKKWKGSEEQRCRHAELSVRAPARLVKAAHLVVINHSFQQGQRATES